MRWRPDAPPAKVLSAGLDTVPRRRLTADAYWARLAPRLRDFGITRVADITGLDHVGLPVAQAVRPWARSNAVTQGKAQSLAGAAVGAVLECLEMAAGEDLDHLSVVPSADLDLWAPLEPGATWPVADTPFVPAWNLTADAPAVVPRDLISTDFARGADAEAAPILRHSIGLGAGATLEDAMQHGLLEALEADARIRAEASGFAPRLTLDPSDAAYGAILRLIEAAGLRAAVSDISRHPGIVTVMASVMEAPGVSALPLPALGYAARFDPGQAVAAALMEAVQARLAVISGAREDLTQTIYAHGESDATLRAVWAEHAPCAARAIAKPDQRDWSLRDLVALAGPVFAVPLHWDATLPLAIVRIIAPDLIGDPMRLQP